jgi:hypothetical protein
MSKSYIFCIATLHSGISASSTAVPGEARKDDVSMQSIDATQSNFVPSFSFKGITAKIRVMVDFRSNRWSYFLRGFHHG